MLLFQIDPSSPHSVLEDCTYQLDMLVAFLAGSSDNLDLDDAACTGMAATLRAVHDHALKRQHGGRPNLRTV